VAGGGVAEAAITCQVTFGRLKRRRTGESVEVEGEKGTIFSVVFEAPVIYTEVLGGFLVMQAGGQGGTDECQPLTRRAVSEHDLLEIVKRCGLKLFRCVVELVAATGVVERVICMVYNILHDVLSFCPQLHSAAGISFCGVGTAPAVSHDTGAPQGSGLWQHWPNMASASRGEGMFSP